MGTEYRSESTAAPDGGPGDESQPQVIYVEREPSGNGMAVAALTLGIVGAVFGLIPILFVIAFACGILALIFGLVGRRRPVRKRMATIGAVLGVVAIGLGILGVVIVDEAVTDFTEDIDRINEDFEQEMDCLDRADTIEQIERC